MNKNIIAVFAVSVAFLSGVMVLSAARQMHTVRSSSASHLPAVVENPNYKPVLPENSNGNVSTSVDVEDVGAVSASVTVQ